MHIPWRRKHPKLSRRDRKAIQRTTKRIKDLAEANNALNKTFRKTADTVDGLAAALRKPRRRLTTKQEQNQARWESMTPLERSTFVKERHRRVRVRKAAKQARKVNR